MDVNDRIRINNAATVLYHHSAIPIITNMAIDIIVRVLEPESFLLSDI